MARMIRTIVSLPEDEKKWLDAHGRRHGISSAEVVRRAIRELRASKGDKSLAVGEDRAAYGSPLPAGITDMADLKRRAIAAAGRFASGAPDLSVSHDRYLTDGLTGGATEGATEGAAKNERRVKRAKKDGGAR